MNSQSTIYITQDDHSKLRLLLSSIPANRPSPTLHQLREELDRAILTDPASMPSGVVGLNSLVEYEDVDTGEIEDFTIVFPERANLEEKRVSILAPIGIALIGSRVGEVVSWTMPGGVRRLKIRRAMTPSVATREPAPVLFTTAASRSVTD